jgi:hypothetical protein
MSKQMSKAERIGNVKNSAPASANWLVLALAWLAVGAPLLWGIARTIAKALPLFS